MEIKKLLFNEGSWNTKFPVEMDSETTIILIFGNNETAINEFLQCFPKSHVAGSSTYGEIHDGHLYEGTISVNIVKFSNVKVRSIAIPYTNYADSYDNGLQVYRSLADKDLEGILVFTKSIVFDGDRFAAGLNKENTKNIPIGGGLAGDPAVKDTWVITRRGKSPHSVVALGFYGTNFHMLISTESGASPLGIERKITKSDKNVLYEVNNSKALDFYKECLGDEFKNFGELVVQYPVTISTVHDTAKVEVIRTPFFINEQDQSITFSGEIPQGHKIRLMVAGSDEMVLGSEKAAQDAKRRINKKRENPAFILLVSCSTRKVVMGKFTEEEIDMVQSVLSDKSYSISGYYAFGELVSDTQGSCVLQNQTINLISLYEDAA